jgi:glyoxylate/hydroxypyruvate reductase A
MRVVVVAHHDAIVAARWRDALARELPEAEIAVWEQGSGDAAYAIVSTAPSQAFFEGQPQLKALFTTGAGVDKLLANAALPTTLPVIRLEDAGMGAQMANYCIAEALHWLGRRDEYAEQQRARLWRQRPEADLIDWPVGVFGLGVLGRQVAHAFAALGFVVNGYARSARTDAQITCFADSGGAGDFNSFLKASRILILLAPLTPATQDRFDYATLSQLPKGAYVINVARGGLLVDGALLALLDSGHLAGAALDVFRQEPLPPEHPFWTHPKIRMTPHISAITVIGPSARQIAEKIRRLERAEPVSGVVDRARGY